MSLNFGTPKTTTGFALPTTTASTTGFQFGGAAGDAKTSKPSITLTFTPLTSISTSTTTTITPTPSGFSLTSTTASTSAPQFSLGTAVTTGNSSLSFPATTTAAPLILNVPTPSASTTTTSAVSSVFSLSASTPSKQTTTTTAITTTSLSTTSTNNFAVTTTASSITSGTGTSNTLTFAQLEDSINKWTICIEDEGKHFSNQAKQINAWDRLLIINGEKILRVSDEIERIKQLQDQLNQELDFILAQQKELEDLIGPLYEELGDIPISDLDRHRTYQIAETVDMELKQMSEDLKEIVEHLNESNKNQELSNPITQISRILNVHMNSLQWIDRNTTKITTHLDLIAKMHDMNKRNQEINLQRSYE